MLWTLEPNRPKNEENTLCVKTKACISIAIRYCQRTKRPDNEEFWWAPFWSWFGPWGQTRAWPDFLRPCGKAFWEQSQSLLYWGDSARSVCPCLCPTVAEVELCHWPCWSLHTLCHHSLTPTSSYSTKNTPPYVLNLYKWEADAIKLSSCFNKIPGLVCFFWAIDTCHPSKEPAIRNAVI